VRGGLIGMTLSAPRTSGRCSTAAISTPGKEKLHALGALGHGALDIKGKALGVPVYGCWAARRANTPSAMRPGFPAKGIAPRKRACLYRSGLRAYRIGPADGTPWDRFDMVAKTAEIMPRSARRVGKDGAWAVDFHTRSISPTPSDSQGDEDLGPYFVRTWCARSPGVYRTLRGQ